MYSKITQRTIATSSMELYVVLISGFQLLPNFTKKTILGATGAVEPTQEYCNVF